MNMKKQFALLIALLIFTCLNATAQDYKKKLDAINGDIDEVNGKLAKLKQEKKSLLNDIYKIELHYDKEVIETNKIELQMRDTREKIQVKETEKSDLEIQVRQSMKKLKKVLRILYKVGGNTYLKLFIRVNSVDQLYKNYRYFLSLINFKSDEITKIKSDIRQLDTIRHQLDTQYKNLGNLKKEQAVKMKNIKRLKGDKVRLVKKINSDGRQYRQLIEEMKYEAARLNEVILGKKVKSSLRDIKLNRLKGRLKWPINGKVISRFEKEKSTRFNTYVNNEGIKIRPSSSDNIKAVYSGDVIFAEYYKGYGNLIILQHSRDLYTLYGHCKGFKKKKGDPVIKDEVIAVAGDTGSTYGKSLYFAIRIDLNFRDPLLWLRKIKYNLRR
ncbi:MAG: peptidoglycan DD-metalloendopeptidase family protein [bacterium]|nr:peptidoglycan DD-metalloendopeptidase family protein [bacterium]